MIANKQSRTQEFWYRIGGALMFWASSLAPTRIAGLYGPLLMLQLFATPQMSGLAPSTVSILI
jgi:hypothetical protein